MAVGSQCHDPGTQDIVPDGFAKLTASAIRKGTRKKGTPLEDPVFTHFEDVSQAVEALAAAREREQSARSRVASWPESISVPRTVDTSSGGP